MPIKKLATLFSWTILTYINRGDEDGDDDEKKGDDGAGGDVGYKLCAESICCKLSRMCCQ